MKYILFLFSSLVFIGSFMLSLRGFDEVVVTRSIPPADSLLPVLGASDTFPLLTAQSIMVKDLTSGVTLYEKNPDLSLLPASTTKVMTALVSLQFYNLDDEVVIQPQTVIGQKMGLVTGERITVRNLLYGTLVYSANDAAEALARYHPNGREHFIDLMNQTSKALNLTNTHFQNPTGLDGSEHVSSARDMVRLSEYAMQNDIFAKIVATKEITVYSVDEKFVHRLKNINVLLNEVDGVQGVKTGWTENARENLVTYIKRDDRELLIALLGSQDRFGETKELINWVWSNYSWVEVSPSADSASPASSASTSGLY